MPHTPKTVTLIDGTQVDSRSEAWRHECEARHIANLPAQDARAEYLAKVMEKRGYAAGEALSLLAQQVYAIRPKS